ncbi:hypothetical protein RHSIM_Rhsim06G0136100 [Rhododendron simsii]|uniref:Glutaredoxin domain-containing protein n=1 Tax=Rhododendron simsii TaxID=118357 RepID=A0A834LIJ1_RHOSS|nr:hypothetical protein RHSIM_Rhsim06G0136100 [Rhododendron simsii]
MQEALPYKTWQPIPHQTFLTRSPKPNPIPVDAKSVTKPLNLNGSVGSATNKSPIADVRNMVSENAVIVFGKRGCCMSHVVKRLLQGLGVNPVVFEIEESDENGVVDELEAVIGGGGDEEGGRRLQFPAVFIGGELFGGLDRIMATHITGELIPVLKKAGALWL